MTKVLAFDYGMKRTGYASGDLDMKIAFAGKVLENKSHEALAGKIVDLVKEYGADTLVFGLPLNMQEDHKVNAVMVDLKNFLRKLEGALNGGGLEGVKIELLDERLSSFEADEKVAEIKAKTGDKELSRDAYSAQVILERFFAL